MVAGPVGEMSHLKVAFRADASLQIGTGHIMRCLTLADALREKGAQCTFVCRPHAGHLLDLVAQRGHKVLALGEPQANFNPPADPAHAIWLGTSWAEDAEETKRALGERMVDWLVVDHYALDACWEEALRPQAKRIMVIDDLADRPHACDLLLDQTLGRRPMDYAPWVPDRCKLLCGAQYALLRPEFAALREYSLKRRVQPVLKELLINMGGVDKDNVTEAVLRALQSRSLPEDCRLTVVMGQTAPWLENVQNLACSMQRPTRVLVGVNNMAQLMADSDLAIGAAGATSWERCCLGLPSIMLVVADNQLEVAKGLEDAGAALLCLSAQGLSKQLAVLLDKLFTDSEQIALLSKAAAKVANGTGAGEVLEQMEYKLEHS
jgi:UDP-2,4-diacetamido-2,4,6-trideoxy-beta-L-altropyranose hydrolase